MHFKVQTIGLAAYESLKTSQRLKVLTRISSGIFLTTDRDDILFLTDRLYKGPLTLNVDGKSPEQGCYKNDCEGIFKNNSITFRDTDWKLIIHPNTEIWQAEIKQNHIQTGEKLFQRCRYFSQCLLKKNVKSEHLSSSDKSLPDENPQWEQEYLNRKEVLAASLRNQDERKYHEALASLIGLGNGLTPAGDDFACGVFLANHYFGKNLFPNLNLTEINRDVLRTTEMTTTSLSRNLMRCALQGDADERIINCLDWLIRSEGDLNKKIEELRTYGSSSGTETLAGILTFIEQAIPNP